MSTDLISVIFGMKLRQARTETGLTLSDFATQCELSPSYVTEIEKGRKYPRADKIMRMAEVLGRSYDELVSIKLQPSLAHLESTISSNTFQKFPFEEFGLEASDLVNLLTREPDKASALLHAVLEIGRHYDLKEEDFLRAALRSYQEIYENHFPDMEQAALDFITEFGSTYHLSADSPIDLDTLQRILQHQYNYQIDDQAIAQNELLSGFRSVLRPGSRPKLFINGKLYPRQRNFILARELGYRYLGIKERSLTSPPEQIKSFQQLLNELKAAYFGGVLLMPRAAMLADLQAFFDLPTWQPERLLHMLTKYDVTPEMLLYRFSELVPQFFGVKLHFLRFHDLDGRYRIIKQLNMNRLLVPSGIGLMEHYCRRWLSIRLLQDMSGENAPNSFEDEPLVGVQFSEFLESHDKFLCLGFGRPLVLSPDLNSSVIVGFRVDANLKDTIRFLEDPAIPRLLIHETCERCPLTADQCQVRGAPPTILQANEQKRAQKLALNQLQ